MGTTMTGIVEYKEAAVPTRPEWTHPIRDWTEEDIHGVQFEIGKDYLFFAAISGVRDALNRPSLIPPRGVPERMSWLASYHFKQYGSEMAGWLLLSEIESSIEHLGVNRDHFSFEAETVLMLMRALVDRLSDEHVRLVFNFSF